MSTVKEPKKRKPKPLSVSLPKITWFGMHQSVAWLHQKGLMEPEWEEAYTLFPSVTVADEDVREIAKPEESRRRGWSIHEAYFGTLRGTKSVNVPPHLAKTMAALLRVVGYVLPDTQRSSTVLSRAAKLEEIDVLDLMAGV